MFDKDTSFLIFWVTVDHVNNDQGLEVRVHSACLGTL